MMTLALEGSKVLVEETQLQQEKVLEQVSLLSPVELEASQSRELFYRQRDVGNDLKSPSIWVFQAVLV